MARRGGARLWRQAVTDDPDHGARPSPTKAARERATIFLPDGKRYVAAGSDGARLMRLGADAPDARVTAHAAEITAIALAPDGKRLATASADHTVVLTPLAP